MTCFNQSSSEADCEYPFDYRNAHDLRGERFVMFTPYYGFAQYLILNFCQCLFKLKCK